MIKKWKIGSDTWGAVETSKNRDNMWGRDQHGDSRKADAVGSRRISEIGWNPWSQPHRSAAGAIICHRHHFTSGTRKSRGEMGYLGKVVNIPLALRWKDFKPLDERKKGKCGFAARRFDRSGYLLSAIAASWLVYWEKNFSKESGCHLSISLQVPASSENSWIMRTGKVWTHNTKQT